MMIEPIHILAVVAVGIGATAVLDVWAMLLKRAFNVPLPNYCFVGRWLRHMPQGTFTHHSIAASPRKSLECAVGWAVHYLIGVAFAVGLVLLASKEWLQRPTLLPALLFGIATVAVPFLVMHPAFGLGVAASKTPNPTQARLRSLMAHTVFGIGLYASALALGPVLRAT
jgi:hypothetical protein